MVAVGFECLHILPLISMMLSLPIINRIIQMNRTFQAQGYQNYGYSNPLESRVRQLQTERKQWQGEKRQLQADKQALSAAIEELNLCYQEKIRLLEATISHQQQRYEEALEWKQQHMGRGLLEVEKYENEIRKMIDILDNAHGQFEAKQTELQQEVQAYRTEIAELREENEALRQFNAQNESRIEQVVRTYMEEIGKLKEELRLLREDSVSSEEAALPLCDITARHNLENIAPNQKLPFSIEPDPSFSKFSIDTGSE